MEAKACNLSKFLKSEMELIIPVYQRNYEWGKEQCEQLRNDIIYASKKETEHFIGSIVYIKDSCTSQDDKYTIIDGQQRLTSVMLLILAIYSKCKEINHDKARELNNKYLINEYKEGEEKLKLKPIKQDRDAFRFLYRDVINGSAKVDDYYNQANIKYSKIIENYKIFKKFVDEPSYNIDNILKGLYQISFVEIGLTRDKDNPQRIFQSLNSTGLDLAEADLIRNYILMELNDEAQSKIYKNYWKPIEDNIRDKELEQQSGLTAFIRSFMLADKMFLSNEKLIFEEFRKRYKKETREELEENLKKLKKFSEFYNKIVNPSKESDKKLRRQLTYIKFLNIDLFRSLLLFLYEKYQLEEITNINFVEILKVLLSYLTRRYVCNLETKGYNKSLPKLIKDLKSENLKGDEFVEHFKYLITNLSWSQVFPTDNEFKNALESIDILRANTKARIKYMFDVLENNFNSNEAIDILTMSELTIEHIFPQKPSHEWGRELDEKDYEYLTERLNRIANLTISGNNSRLSNKSFLTKKNSKEYGYSDSRLYINHYFKSIEKWTRKEYDERLKKLTKDMISAWSRPQSKYIPAIKEEKEDKSFEPLSELDDVSNKKPVSMILLEDEYKLPANTFVSLFNEIIEILVEKYPEHEPKIRSSRPERGISGKDTINKIKRLFDELELDEYTDLKIKFAN